MKAKLISIIAIAFLFMFANSSIAQNKKFYKQKWQEVDSADHKGLPKTGLKIVTEIYEKAKAENNSEQVIKSFIYNLKYKNMLEENAFERLCKELDSTANVSKFPDNAIMHSMLADMYWWYYQNNRWKFYNRTNTVNFDNDDMQTWTLDFLVSKIIKEYRNSLYDIGGLQKISISEYPVLISKGSQPTELRPTLYDFLANKAIDFFSNTEIALTKPADNYEIKEDFYFEDINEFVNREIQSSDSLSLHFHAQCISQDLLKFRLARKSETMALIDADLRRLKFNYVHSVNSQKNNLYLKSLERLEQKFPKNNFISEVSLAKAQYYYNISKKYNPEQKETSKYKFYKKTASEICDNIIKNYPKQKASEYAKRLNVQIQNHSLTFKTEKVVSSNQKFSVFVEYQNTDKIYVKLAKIDREKFKKIVEDNYYGKKQYDKLLKESSQVYTFSKDVINDGDFNNHSTEILLKGLPLGVYILFISNNEKFTYKKGIAGYSKITVSNISYVKQSLEDGSTRFFVCNRKTGEPLQGVEAQSWKREYSSVRRKYVRKNGAKYISDKNGNFTVLASEKNYAYARWSLDFKYKEDFLSSEDDFYSYKRHKDDKAVVKIHLFTDRAIYRPGQKIYFKGVAIWKHKDETKILPNHKETVVLYDVNSQKQGELHLTTNEYGTFSGTFDIPMGLLNGNFRIYTENGAKNIKVEEYKRPKFEVEMLPFNGNYLLNDDIEISGKATTYSGASLSDAKVKYRIIRTPQWNGWWTRYFNTTSTEIANGEIITDDSGVFKIKFKALPDLAIEKSEFTSFSYKIIADVTDINGETQSTSKSINVGYRALKLSVSISSTINKNDEIYSDTSRNKVRINTLNLNGEKITAQGEINIYKLKDVSQVLRKKSWQKPDKHLFTKEEWYSQFPNNVYTDEDDIKKMQHENLVSKIVFDTKNSRKFDFSIVKKYETGHYVAEISAKDAFGNPVSNKMFFDVISDNSKKMPFKSNFLFSVLDDSCEPGETAKFLIASSLKNVKVLYEIEHKGKIVSSEFIKLNNEQKIIEIPVEEKHRGGFSVSFVFVKNNRLYKENARVHVPYSNKKLDIEFASFRNKLQPGEKEEWLIKIRGPKGEKVASEMLATLYDASLDKFAKNYWHFNIYNSYYSTRQWSSDIFATQSSTLLKEDLDNYIYVNALSYPTFNWFGFSYYRNVWFGGSEGRNTFFRGRRRRKARYTFSSNTEDDEESDKFAEAENAPPPPPSPKAVDGIIADSSIAEQSGKKTNGNGVKIRTNFNETAFFYPHLKTNKDGDVIVKFTIPESLTKWKMMGFALTKDLKYGFINEELITQKELMLLPNEPRFFRENDKMSFPVKVSNVSEKDLNGKITLEFFDAITMKPVKNIFAKGEKSEKDFSVNAKKNTLVSWNIEIPEDVGALMYKVVAKAGDFSDGEQKPIPVLTNRMLVTESLPLPVRGNQTKTYKLKKLINSGKSKTLKHHKLTLEFTSNPAWYAVQALPYLIEYPYECTEQTFSRYYANSLASHIANSSPKIKRVFDSWKNTPNSKALLSNLEKNQELKSLLLEETPWVLDGKDESARKRRIGLLFDLNRMSNEMNTALKKIQKSQMYSGGWSWFPGMQESRYITQHIVTGMGHLDRLGVKTVRQDTKTWGMIKKAISYLDRKIDKDYDWLKKNYTAEEMKKNHLSNVAIQYLYGRSYFTDLPIPKSSQKAFDYYKGQAEKYWLSQSKYMQGMIALSLHRYKNKTVPTEIMNSLREKSIEHEEMGMYWKDNVAGYYWYQAPIEQQALMIEAFDEVANDQKSVESLKVWLLKQKQTQDWKTTKATTEAIYALLMRGTDLLASDKLVEIKMAGKIIDPKKLDNVKVEAGTGYFKTSWSGGEIKPEMGEITVTKHDKGVAWGALYWQYFEQLDKITPHKTPLKLKKQLFIEKTTDRGVVIEPISKQDIKVGDKIIVRIELRVDRRMEYVHMKDMRASGFEPINVISRYKYQDGLGYYESTKDASTNFFMDRLPKGTYVFEYPLRVTHKGDFSNGITTIQCMYAPEFTSHSEGIRVKIED